MGHLKGIPLAVTRLVELNFWERFQPLTPAIAHCAEMHSLCVEKRYWENETTRKVAYDRKSQDRRLRIAFNSAITLIVSDNGRGVPTTDREKVFNSFYTTKIEERVWAWPHADESSRHTVAVLTLETHDWVVHPSI